MNNLESIWGDTRYAVRNLRRQPGFTAVVVLVLGTVIGLHTTLATVLAGVLLRPWPGMTDPSHVVAVYLLNPGGRASGFAFGDFRRIAAGAKTLTVAAMTASDVRIGSGDGARPAEALRVTANFFPLLGIEMALGRSFRQDEARPGAPEPVALLAYDVWQSRFGGDRAVIGSTIRVDDAPFTVIGVVAREFASSEHAYGKSLYLPLSAADDYCCVDIVGRLARGVSRGQARAELDVLNRALAAPDASTRRMAVTGTELFARPERRNSPGPFVVAGLLTTALVIVWLIACANIGNLLLARAAARVREIGVRLSLGASRARLVRQLLTEGFVLALAASALGVGIAYRLPFLVLYIVGGNSGSFPFQVTPDGVVLGYAVLLAALSSIAFALAPALYATRADVASALTKGEGLPLTRFPLRGLLLGVQVAMSVILLVSAGLLVRGAQQLSVSFDPGFAVKDVTVISFELPAGAYDDARRRALFGDLEETLRQANLMPFGFASSEPLFIVRGFATTVRRPDQPAEQARPMLFVETSSTYLNVLRIPIVAGRGFEPGDVARPFAIVNETMARQYWPDDTPVGKTFLAGRAPREVIGVMRDAHTHSLNQVPPLFYQPLASGRPVPKLFVRTDGPAPIDEIARMVARIDPRVRVQARPLSANLDDRLREARLGPLLAGLLGAFALALSTVGMFGVFAYAVRQRTREIGIRMALGAQPSAVVRLVLGGHSRAVVAGLGAGLAGGLMASVVLRSRLHGMSAFDPLTYLSVAAILSIAGLAASYLPAGRAVRVDPVEALRHE